MKKILVFAVIVALLVPAVAFAKAEFSLGGFIKLDSYWDSTQNGKNMNGVVLRNNDPNFHHGNMRFTAQGSRFSFTIKGPKVFGAQTTGFIEMDFDSTTDQNASASNSYVPRLRHAMFRFNWPETELLFGQYWSMFCEWYIEAAEDGPLQVTGTPTARLAQVRLTQKFAGDWTVAGLIGNANSTFLYNNNPYNASTNSGQDAETPQVQGKLQYQHDWWGKAAYYGRPIPFTARVVGGLQRNVARTVNNLALTTINNPGAGANVTVQNTYTMPWLVMGSVFIPVIPTHTANLAGTAHLLTQWWIGQGVNSFGFTGDATAVFKFNNRMFGNWLYDVDLVKRYGGFVEGQYYFTNQWFANAAYAITRTYGVNQSLDAAAINGQSYAYNGTNNQISTHQQLDFTLWYRPIQAIKFGLQYAWARSDYWTNVTTPGANTTNFGNEHRVEFVGFFYF